MINAVSSPLVLEVGGWSCKFWISNHMFAWFLWWPAPSSLWHLINTNSQTLERGMLCDEFCPYGTQNGTCPTWCWALAFFCQTQNWTSRFLCMPTFIQSAIDTLFCPPLQTPSPVKSNNSPTDFCLPGRELALFCSLRVLTMKAFFLFSFFVFVCLPH